MTTRIFEPTRVKAIALVNDREEGKTWVEVMTSRLGKVTRKTFTPTPATFNRIINLVKKRPAGMNVERDRCGDVFVWEIARIKE